MNCRHCKQPLGHKFLDLGFAPASNAYLDGAALSRPERYFPLRIQVCESCWLVQTEDYTEFDELFDADYAYFSSTSSTWCQHALKYTDMITERLALGESSHVVELASNDGYLLKNFVARDIPCLGIEPTASTAKAAESIGVPVLQEYFSNTLAGDLLGKNLQADLVIGNNVYAHVPDIDDFTAGIATLLKPGGVVTLEFPHLLELIRHCQFDTVYHEHFSYLSLSAVQLVFSGAGLKIFDVEKLATHGGSLRVFGCLAGADRPVEQSVDALLQEEADGGLLNRATYQGFQKQADAIKNGLLTFLIDAKASGKKVCAYGAAAKGNTLLNYAGVKPDLIEAVYDAAESKQGMYMPGSHLPIFHPERIVQDKPDYLLVLPWNIAAEITSQHEYVRQWGCRFFAAVPEMREFV